MLIRPVHRSIDGPGLSSLACRSRGPARSTSKKVADVHCGIGSCGVPRPSLDGYVTDALISIHNQFPFEPESYAGLYERYKGSGGELPLVPKRAIEPALVLRGERTGQFPLADLFRQSNGGPNECSDAGQRRSIDAAALCLP